MVDKMSTEKYNRSPDFSCSGRLHLHMLIQSELHGIAGNTHCRQCGEGINLYMERHDHALLAVYHNLCKHYGFEVTPRWWELKPLLVRENQRA